MNGQPDMVFAAIKMVVALVVCLGGIAGLYWVMRRFSGRGGPAGRRLIEVIENRHLGSARKTVSLVRVPGAVLLLGVSEQGINLLTTIDPDDLNGEPPPGAAGNRLSFADHLSRFTTGKKRD